MHSALAQKLTRLYGDRIADITVQITLYQLRQGLIKKYPTLGTEYFNSAVRQAFPNEANDIIALMEKLDRYHEWLSTQQTQLSRLSSLERYGTIWNKRHEIFAEDADLLWAEERHEIERKQQQVQLILSQVDANSRISLEEKLYQLNIQLDELLSESTVQYGNREDLITQVYFSLDSVQQTLSQLPPDQRQQQIDNLRRQSGYNETKINELRHLDQKRNLRWQRGLAYMRKREKLIDHLNGEALAKGLNDLRVEFFGYEAKTIEQEELSGFFRYLRPRMYGRN
ncbi:hypothetical protein [Gynuella sp.]|uniref:hypothetical protein n=1 Tax=Gynuella sp. TaxID=2969146 RepID=UPI003D0B92D1